MISTKNKGSSSWSRPLSEMEKHVLLCEAIKNNRDIQTIQLLLKNGSNVNGSLKTQKCDTPLHYATRNGNIEIAALLLDKDAKIDAGNEYEETSLHYAVANGNIEIAAMLLDRGAKIDARNRYDNETPLHYAVNNGNIEIAAKLLDRGAKIHAGNQYGETPLHYAAKKGNKEIAVMLLDRCAKIDAPSLIGETPLHTAAESSSIEMVEFLLHRGATINAKNMLGQTPLYTAIFSWFNEMQKLRTQVVIALLDYGADINDIKNKNVRDAFCSGIIKRHIVKMKTAKMYLTEKLLLSVNDENELKIFQNACEEEIEQMKYAKIGNSTVSYYDMLTKSTNLIAKWTRNDNIVEILKFGDYKRKYPIYVSMINSNFRKGVERNELLKQSNKLFCSLSKSLPELPYNCIDKIFSYLNNKDLKKFIIK